jgi:hypothetical protein
MVLAIVTEVPLQLHAVEPDPFLDPPASGAVPVTVDRPVHHAADTGVTSANERVLTGAVPPVR